MLLVYQSVNVFLLSTAYSLYPQNKFGHFIMRQKIFVLKIMYVFDLVKKQLSINKSRFVFMCVLLLNNILELFFSLRLELEISHKINKLFKINPYKLDKHW